MGVETLIGLKQSRMLLDVSLWSGNLVNLAQSIEETENLTDCYHLDVSDAHYVPSLLFFPDLIKAIDGQTEKPLHVHLMMTDPLDHLETFVEAGADIISLHVDQGEERLLKAADYLAARGVTLGLVLRVEDDVASVLPYLKHIGLILVMGTRIGIKGASLEESTPTRIKTLKELMAVHDAADRIILSADGGIREHTVAELRGAGADMVTPGSLMFGSPDMQQTVDWLHSL
ncbi:MAG: ribulose-phosphate 3-epimerase [Spirochaetales bacterium]|nr:ribulose-phosphate 3-epimerase [Spirochaetales bacterium]